MPSTINNQPSTNNMHHLAIMNKKWGMIEKILSGEKTVESRWCEKRNCPWDKVAVEDLIYFKNSGESVYTKAIISKVTQYENLTVNEILKILNKYHTSLGIEKSELNKYFELFKRKKYCVLMFLTKIERVEPFNIDKKRARKSPMVAWVTLSNISEIKVIK